MIRGRVQIHVAQQPHAGRNASNCRKPFGRLSVLICGNFSMGRTLWSIVNQPEEKTATQKMGREIIWVAIIYLSEYIK